MKNILRSVAIVGASLFCMQFNAPSYADAGKGIGDDPVPGIYTGTFIIGGGAVAFSYNLETNGAVIETSEGMVNNPAQRETTGSGAWQHAKGGGVNIVEVLYMNGGAFCAAIAQNNCTVIVGVHATISQTGLLNGSLTNLTIKSVDLQTPIVLNATPFVTTSLVAQKQNFNDLLFPAP